MVRVIKRIIIELDVTRNLFYIARRQCVGAKKKKGNKNENCIEGGKADICSKPFCRIKKILIKTSIAFANPDSFVALRTMIYSRMYSSINIELCIRLQRTNDLSFPRPSPIHLPVQHF